MTSSGDGFLALHGTFAEAVESTLDDEKRRESARVLFSHFDGRATVQGPREVGPGTVTALLEASALRRKLGIEGYVGWLAERSHPLQSGGHYAVAERLWRDAALEADEKLGPDHPSTARSVNNLACCLNDQGRHSEAEPLHRKALEIGERVLGPDHPDTKRIMRNLLRM